MARKGLFLGLAWGLLGLTAAFLWLAAGPHVAAGSAAAAEWTVCSAGPPDCQFDSVQAAVDAAGAGDTIKVAAGTYTDVHTRPVPAGYDYPPASGVLTQVVYISKALSLQGGYTTANWLVPDPVLNVTTLDANGAGRVAVVVAPITSPVVLEGLYIVAGNAAGLGGIYSSVSGAVNGTGGGLYVAGAAVTVTGCTLVSNTGTIDGTGAGGAAYVKGAEFTMEGCTVVSNTAATGMTLPAWAGLGGGLYLKNSTVLLAGTVLSENAGGRGAYAQIYGQGGGAYVENSNLTIRSCTVVSNVAGLAPPQLANSCSNGGGLYLANSQGEISGTLVAGNVAQKGGYCYNDIFGGGIYMMGDMTLRNNIIRHNVVKTSQGSGVDAGWGGGVAFGGDSATLVSNTIESNIASLVSQGMGGGVFGGADSITLHGNLIRDNAATWDDTGLYPHGGGVLLDGGAVTVTNNVIRRNWTSAHDSSDYSGGAVGGGGWVSGDTLYFADNLVEDNVASVEGRGFGGGIFVDASSGVVAGNVVRDNRAGYTDSRGGGLLVDRSLHSLLVTDNVVVSNTATTLGWGVGGGVSVAQQESGEEAVLRGNLVMNNVASRQGDGHGGGIAAEFRARATLAGNLVLSNTATLSPTAEGLGGGLFADYGARVNLENDVLAGNRAGTEGSGLWLGRTSIYYAPASGQLRHVTLADNEGGAGVYVGPAAEVALTDTILAGHSLGITVAQGATATLEATLWHGNGQDWAGAGAITTGTVNVWGDPNFVDPAAWDYHLGPGSAAIDAGIDAGVLSDLDGQARPAIGGYDIGADEFYGPRLALAKTAAPDPVLSGGLLTYTLRLTNSGTVALAATVTDHLPAEVMPAGVLTWTLPPLPAGQTWSRTVAVTVAAGYLGTLTNRLAADSAEGAAGAYTHTATVVEGAIAGLVAWNDGPTTLGDTTLLTATVTAGTNVTYTWALGDEASAGGPLVAHVYPATGTYTALVTAANSLGWMTATDVVQVAAPPWHVYLPLVVRSSP